MIERIDSLPYDPARFLEDIRETAKLIDAPFAEDATQRALEVFDEEFRTCVVQLKAVCKSGTGVYFRFFYNGPNDLTERALEAGLLGASDPSNVWLQADILDAFRGATRAGLDFDSGYGLAKVWTFTGGPVPVEEISALPAIPQAVRDHADFFTEHGLKHVFFVASDYQSSTMNIYFGWDDALRTPEWIEAMIAATGGAGPSAEISIEILDSQAASGGVGMTFSWDSPELLRWCLYSLEVPQAQLNSTELTLPPRLQRFVTAPTLNLQPQFNVAWSFGGKKSYIKVEKSYARDATYFLTEQMGGDLSHALVNSTL